MRRILAILLCLAGTAAAQPQGVVTQPSPYPVRETLDRLSGAIRAAGWVVFTEIDHAAAARAAGLELPSRTVLIFGNPRAGTGAMRDTPTLALDLPMRLLVWQDGLTVRITRSTGADTAERVFARHGIAVPAAGQAASEAFLASVVEAALRP